MNVLDNLCLSALLGDRGIFAQVEVKVAKTREELANVYKLTHDSYVEYQYAAPHSSNMLIQYPYFDHLEETRVLIARFRGNIVGTISYTVDGPGGLTVDEDFRPRCDEERSAGKKIAAVWRLVVSKKQRDRRGIVTSLIREAVNGLLKQNVERCFFSVNPRHENVYKRMLNVEVAAKKDITKGLLKAPEVLLLGRRKNLPVRVISADPRLAEPVPIPILLNVYTF